VEQHIGNYRFDLLAGDLFEFFWDNYCSWYLEFTKVQLKTNKNTTQYVLLYALEKFLRLLHPTMPFVSEELWQKVVKFFPNIKIDSLAIADFPIAKDIVCDTNSFNEVENINEIISAIRTIRGKHGISPSLVLSVYIEGCDEFVKKYVELIFAMAKAKVEFHNAEGIPCALEVVRNSNIKIPFGEFINKDEEVERLEKLLIKNEAIILQIENKLNNKKFVDNAPKNVVEEQKNNLKELKQTQEKLAEQKQQISKL
jgi:valyl-tRNA synthetase